MIDQNEVRRLLAYLGEVSSDTGTAFFVLALPLQKPLSGVAEVKVTWFTTHFAPWREALEGVGEQYERDAGAAATGHTQFTERPRVARVITMSEFRKQPGEVLHEVMVHRRAYVLTKLGKPAAQILPVDDKKAG